MREQAVGSLLLGCGGLAFAYYTAWVLLLPMWTLEDAPWLHAAFPPRRLALQVPGLLLTTLVAGLTGFVGIVLAGGVRDGEAAGDSFGGSPATCGEKPQDVNRKR
ncbi:unnamed protein product [Polarella glacialis]|uniref:Dolichol phosphate-mannose biosynthesis regulatory protein n=1 Tax=Polarella glacialis TaxID=89957 RepID=A0A813I2P0_POLGL|nr:unnamed protein product [Polarella glacialis]